MQDSQKKKRKRPLMRKNNDDICVYRCKAVVKSGQLRWWPKMWRKDGSLVSFSTSLYVFKSKYRCQYRSCPWDCSTPSWWSIRSTRRCPLPQSIEHCAALSTQMTRVDWYREWQCLSEGRCTIKVRLEDELACVLIEANSLSNDCCSFVRGDAEGGEAGVEGRAYNLHGAK